jgi:tRNA(Ile2)-agmatinylcytidine synthase
MEDHTYELLAYREPGNRGRPRRVDQASVFRMDESTRGRTFSNVDNERKRVLITPRGPDPILLGIRGETPADVKDAFRKVIVEEDVERWVVFRTNQGTDMHLPPDQEIASLRPYRPTTLLGIVTERPRETRGGHVFFRLGDRGDDVCCAAYEPSGRLRNVVRKLEVGDYIRVAGGVRPSRGRIPMTVNLERIEILNLAPKVAQGNPTCPNCNKRMESMGHMSGYRCKRCGLREAKAEPHVSTLSREIDLGVFLPPPRAQRHLTKPFSRYGLEKTYAMSAIEPFWGLGADVR